MAIKLRTLIFVLALFGVLLFAALNWGAFVELTPLNLIVGTFMVPLGAVMLAIVAGLSVLYLIFLAKSETEKLVGSRRTSRELDEARKLALSAEESRLAALREEVREGMAALDDKLAEVLRRVDSHDTVAVHRETTVLPERATGEPEDPVR